jgi:hypothetical protein
MSSNVSSQIQKKIILCNKNNYQKLSSATNIENKKILQNILDNKISLNYKVLKDIKYSNLKCNEYNKLESNCIVKSLVKEDWTNIDKSNLDKLGLARQTRL